MHSLKDFLAESQRHIEFHDANIKRYNELIKENRNKANHLEKQRQDVVLRIIKAAVPDFSEGQLKKFSQLLHNVQLATWHLVLEREVATTKERIAAILADPEYIQREILIHPKTGEYVLEFNQINAVYEKVDEEYAPYKKYTFEFEDLIKDLYDTPEYEHTGILRFFNNEHLDNWRIGDILCEAFGVERFTPLKEKYLEIKKQHDELYDAVKHYRLKINYIEKMVTELAQLQERLPQLPDIYFNNLAQEAERFFESTSKESVLEFFAAYPELDGLAKVHQGLGYQRQYLMDFQAKLIAEKDDILNKRTRLSNERNRYASNQHKYQGKKWTSDKFKKRFNRNHSYISSRFLKYEKTNNLLANFNDYAVPGVLTSIFWWEVITNNKVDGSFSPDVTNYYETHTHDKDNYVEKTVVHQQPRDRDNS